MYEKIGFILFIIIIVIMIFINIIIATVFIGLYFYMKNRIKPTLKAATSV